MGIASRIVDNVLAFIAVMLDMAGWKLLEIKESRNARNLQKEKS